MTVIAKLLDFKFQMADISPTEMDDRPVALISPSARLVVLNHPTVHLPWYQ